MYFFSRLPLKWIINYVLNKLVLSLKLQAQCLNKSLNKGNSSSSSFLMLETRKKKEERENFWIILTNTYFVLVFVYFFGYIGFRRRVPLFNFVIFLFSHIVFSTEIYSYLRHCKLINNGGKYGKSTTIGLHQNSE